MQSVHDHRGQVNIDAILTSAGYKIRGRRADCPYCVGHSRLTVSVTTDGRFYCHRCLRGGHINSLARKQGISLPPPRIRRASIQKAAFRAWLSQKMTVLADEERRAHKKMAWAQSALSYFPDFQPAWDFLAWFYTRRRTWEQFWESGSDRCGRYWLYRAWRRHHDA